MANNKDDSCVILERAMNVITSDGAGPEELQVDRIVGAMLVIVNVVFVLRVLRLRNPLRGSRLAEASVRRYLF